MGFLFFYLPAFFSISTFFSKFLHIFYENLRKLISEGTMTRWEIFEFPCFLLWKYGHPLWTNKWEIDELEICASGNGDASSLLVLKLLLRSSGKCAALLARSYRFVPVWFFCRNICQCPVRIRHTSILPRLVVISNAVLISRGGKKFPRLKRCLLLTLSTYLHVPRHK